MACHMGVQGPVVIQVAVVACGTAGIIEEYSVARDVRSPTNKTQ